MSRKWLALWCMVTCASLAGSANAQDQIDPRKWTVDPRAMRLQPGENFMAPRQDPNYVPPKQETRVFNTPYEMLTVTPNVRVHPSTTTSQSEVPITRHPTNGNILYASSNAVHFTPSLFISEGMYLSTDGGATWFGSDTTNALPLSEHSGDPAPAIGPDGRLYMSQITSGMGVEYSTNMGATWSNIYQLVSGSQDKNHTFVNDVPSSPYYGNAFVTWSLFTASNPPAVVSYTTNGGVSWTPPVNVLAPPAGRYQQGVNGAVGANGDAYICWQSPMAGSPFTGLGVGFAKSTDGGATWNGSATAYNCNGARTSSLSPWGIRINDFPSMAVDRSGGGRNGWIYIVTNEKSLAPAGSDEDIVMHYSSDGGTTWSTGIRVNQDALNNGKKQYMPWICVDAAGDLNVVYYDNRNSASGDSVEVFVSRSLNGGASWTDIVVSDHKFRPGPIPGLAGGYQGDYIGITSANGKIYPYWADNSTGIYQAWVTSVTTTENFGWVKGNVTNVSGGAAVAGASIDFVDAIPQVGALSDAGGLYKAGAKVDTPGTTRNVTLRARKFGFRDTTISVTLTRDDTTTRSIAMTPVPNGTLVVRTVRRDSSNIRSGISVLFNGIHVASGITDSTTGIFSTVLPLGSYDVLVDPPSPYGSRRFNGVSVATGNNPLYVVVRRVIEHSPAAMRDTLAVGQVHAKTLVITNSTSSDTVAYRLSDDVTAGKMRLGKPIAQPRPVPIEAPQHAKGAIQPAGISQLDGAGGPDGYGYRWIDSDEPGGPAFNWFNIDTAGRGTAITFSNLDDGNSSVPLSLPFPFYGNLYSSTLQVCTNGWISFTSTSTAYSNDAIPSSAEPNNAVYAFWDDLNLGSGGNVKYYYDAANTRFIVQYTNVPFYSGTGTNTFQVILYPNGQILIHYLSMTGVNTSATVGIENADGTVGLQVVRDGSYIHDNLAVKFYLPDAPWLSEAPDFGRINPNSSANITVTFDANRLTQATTYSGKLILDATHPDVTAPVEIPASLSVITATQPTISANPTSLSFPTTNIGATRRDSVRVRNVGQGTLTISSVTSSNSRFAVSITSTSITTGDSARIRVAYTPVIPAGLDTGRIIVLSSDAANPRVDILLSGTSVGAPLFRARVDSLVRPAMAVGTTDSIRFYVMNAGTAAGPFEARAYMYPRSASAGAGIEIPVRLSPFNPYASTAMASTPATGPAPRTDRPVTSDDIRGMSDLLRLVGENAFCANVNTSTSIGYVDKLTLTTPGTFVNLGTTGNTYSFAGDFDSDGTWYAITYPANNLIRIDTTNGAFTVIGLCAPVGAETWTVLEVDPTSGIAYGISSGTSSSTLYTINLSTGAPAVVATITGASNIISGAFDNGGQFYALEQSLDNIVRLDVTTGAATVIGAIGFDARYAQDADFNRTTNTLYLAAYNNGTGAGELRTVNLTTGATTLIGAFPPNIEVTNFAIDSPTGPRADWLTIAPTSGGPIDIADSTLFTARFDATSPVVYNDPGNYFGRIEINPTISPAPDTLRLPVRMFVVPSVPPRLVVQPDSVNVGSVEIGRTDSSKSILVKNIGTNPLIVTGATFAGGSGFGVSRTSFTLNSLDTLRVRVLFTASAPGGVRTARLNWVSNDPTAQSVGLRAVSAGIAHVSVRPDTFYFSRSGTPDTTVASFKIFSTGTDTLRYRIDEGGSLSLDAAQQRSIERSMTQQPAGRAGKCVIDPTPGEGGFDGQGGPDAVGYRWIDSDEPGGPSFNWVDISSVGTLVTFSSLDDGNTNVPFPFTFSYYGTAFSGSINICTNGWLSFTSTATSYTNSAIPSTTAPLNGIFPFWDDLNLTSGGSVYYYNDAANNRFIVEYLNVPHYSTGELYTFQVIFRPDGSILYQYLTMDPALLNSSTIGVQNAGGSVGLQVVFNSTYVHDNLAVLITNDILPWMSTGVTQGTLAPGDSASISLQIHPAGTPSGIHLGYQKVRGNTPDTTANVRVRLNLTPPPNSVTVTSPNGGERWAVGSTQAISWSKTGNVDTVKIELSTAGSSGPWTVLTSGVPAKIGLEKHPKLNARYVEGGTWDNPMGTFSWLIPANTPQTATCFIKVTQKSNSLITDISNAAFTIGPPGVDTTWTVQSSGTTGILYAVKAVSQSVAWVAGAGGVVRRTTDGGANWTAAGTLGIDIYTLTALDANVAFVATSPATGAPKIWKTTNGGTTWAAKESTGVFWNYVHMFDATNGYALGDPPAAGQPWILKKTTNGGETWIPAATVTTASEAGWNNSMMWLNNTNGWFGTNANKVYRTTDGGATWASSPTNLANANSFSVAFTAMDNGLTGSQTGTMNKSTDGGATWAAGPATVGAASLGMWSNPGSSEFWSISGNNVTYSSNSGTSWSTNPRNGYTGTAALNHVNMVRVGDNLYGWACGATGRVVQFVRVSSSTGTPPGALPNSFALHQNYPNPFNPTTKIEYDLPEHATVILKVYNVLGQEVATLFNGEQQPGYHNIHWDGQSSAGAALASGVYFYRFEATSVSGQSHSILKKMMFLK